MHTPFILELLPIGNPYPVDGDRRRYDPVTAIAGSAVLGAGTSLFGGLSGASTAKKASAAQMQAAQAASDKVGAAVGQANAPIAEATQNAQAGVTAAGAHAMDTAGQAKANVDENAKNANALLNPYGDAGAAAAGTLQSGLVAGGDFNKMPTLADLQIDPGYAFRLQQGQINLDRSAAARGGVLSGEAAKAMAGYSQGLASQEYQKAFDRFTTNTQDRYKNLLGMAEQGRLAGTTQSTNLMDAARTGGDFMMKGAQSNLDANAYAGKFGLEGAENIGHNTLTGAMAQGDYLTQRGNAQASGYMGAANAYNGMAGGIANAASSAAMMNLLRNPATTPAALPAWTPPSPTTTLPTYGPGSAIPGTGGATDLSWLNPAAPPPPNYMPMRRG